MQTAYSTGRSSRSCFPRVLERQTATALCICSLWSKKTCVRGWITIRGQSPICSGRGRQSTNQPLGLLQPRDKRIGCKFQLLRCFPQLFPQHSKIPGRSPEKPVKKHQGKRGEPGGCCRNWSGERHQARQVRPSAAMMARRGAEGCFGFVRVHRELLGSTCLGLAQVDAIALVCVCVRLSAVPLYPLPS